MPQPRTLAALAILATLAACDNDVELLSEDPGLPIVYGLIDGSQDRQLLSISRSFRFSDGGNALESAREVDSVYYSAEDLTVTALNVRSGLTTTLERVSLAEEGDVIREEGVFAAAPNFAYRWRLSDIGGEPGDSIVVEGSLPGGETFSVGGTLLRDIALRTNGPLPRLYGLLAESGNTAFRWRRGDVGAEIEVFEVGINFGFTETTAAGTVSRVLYYPLAREVELESDRNSINVGNERFNGLYGFLSSRLEASPDITREFQYVQAVITGGDASYLEFQTLIRANSGITATQELPPFSNVDGGLGLVGVVTQLEQDFNGGLQPASLDTLRLGSRTADLNF